MKILAVEDDPVSQKVIYKYLTSVGECTLADNGKVAVDLFRAALKNGSPFDLVCLDIMMPEMSGQHVLLAIRDFEKEMGISPSAGAKIIMTTGLDDAENVVGAFKNGCEGYITKPIDKAQLMSEIKKLGLYPG